MTFYDSLRSAVWAADTWFLGRLASDRLWPRTVRSGPSAFGKLSCGAFRPRPSGILNCGCALRSGVAIRAPRSPVMVMANGLALAGIMLGRLRLSTQGRSFTKNRLNVRFRLKPPDRFRDRASAPLMTGDAFTCFLQRYVCSRSCRRVLPDSGFVHFRF